VQILVNLVGNAWRYTSEGGDIIVQAQLRDNQFVQIDVKDSGIGIAEKDLAYIFDRFFRSERTEVEVVDGTGLGLSITKSFVEMLGGEIWAKSELDVGSTFSFTLPLESVISEPEATETSAEGEALVLLIDDDPAVIDILKPRLIEKGYRVLAMDNGVEALEFTRNSNQNLALIMVDVLLKGSNGFELLAQLKEDEATARIPIVMVALLVDQDSQDLVLEVIDYVDTSYEPAQILDVVKLALAKTRSQVGDNSDTSARIARVLVVYSDSVTAERLKNALDDCGCHVERAFNSQQALDMAVSQPDLILADIKMSGANGDSVIAQLRHTDETKSIPVIAITDSSVLSANDERVKLLGTNIGQPFSADALVAEMAQIGHNSRDKD
jgi:CheY-like chemotaxis protein